MIATIPGDPIWLRQGVLLFEQINDKNNIYSGKYLTKPCVAIFLDRKDIESKWYVEAYIANRGRILIKEEECLELKNTKE